MKIKGMRWWIVALVFLAAVLNYVDRQTLSVLAPTIQADLHMDNRDQPRRSSPASNELLKALELIPHAQFLQSFLWGVLIGP